MALPDPVAYQVYRGDERPTLPPDKAYAYVLAGNGIFKLAANRHIEALILLARCRVAGLPPLEPYVRLREGRLPGRLLATILDDARRLSWEEPREAMYHLVMQDGRVHVIRPRQRAGAASLAYAGGGDPDIICDLHSHHQMEAFFSSRDDGDEQGFRFYAVIGRIFTRPEIRVRVGVYGDFHPVPVTVLFTDGGPFIDAGAEQ